MSELKGAQRFQYARLLKEKGKNVLDALRQEVASDPVAIAERLFEKAGLRCVDELGSEIKRLEGELSQAERDLCDDSAYVALTDGVESIDQEIRDVADAIEEEYQLKIDALQDEKRVRIAELKRSKVGRVDAAQKRVDDYVATYFEARQPGARVELEGLKRQLNESKAASYHFTAEATRRATAMVRSRDRLSHLVKDAVSRAQVELQSCTTAEQALALMERIPSVAELLYLAESPDGLEALIARFNPSHTFMIAAPEGHQSEPKQGEVGIEVVFGHSDVVA